MNVSPQFHNHSVVIYWLELLIIILILIVFIYLYLTTFHYSYLFLLLSETNLLISYTIQFYVAIGLYYNDLFLRIPYFLVINSLILMILGIQIFSDKKLPSYTIWILLFSGYTAGAILFNRNINIEYNLLSGNWYLSFPYYILISITLLNTILTLEIIKITYVKRKLLKIKPHNISLKLLFGGMIIYVFSFLAMAVINLLKIQLSFHSIYLLGWLVWSIGLWKSPLILTRSKTKPLALYVLDVDAELCIYSYYFTKTDNSDEYDEKKLLLFSRLLTQASADMFTFQSNFQIYQVEGNKMLLKKSLGEKYDVVLVSMGIDMGLAAAFNYFIKQLNMVTRVVKGIGEEVYFEQIDFTEFIKRTFDTVTFIHPVEKPLTLKKRNNGKPSLKTDNTLKKNFEGMG